MKATNQLREEHQGVILALSILEEIAKRLKAKKDVDPAHLKQLLEFLQVFVDKCHHSKEENVLFPAMEKAGIPNEGGPIGMMLIEHNEGRGFIKGLAEAIKKYEGGDKKAPTAIIANIKGYSNLLKSHIDKEDNILYQIAEMHLGKKEQAKLLKEFEKLEKEKIGVGKHEEFHKMLDHLKDIYPHPCI